MLKITAITVGGGEATNTGIALAALQAKRRTDGVVAMSEDEHQDLIELERDQAELGHARWAAMRVRDYLARVVEGGGQFYKGGNAFTHTANTTGSDPLEMAVSLAAEPEWVNVQFNTLRVKPRHMDAAKAHLATLMVALIEREVGEGF